MLNKAARLQEKVSCAQFHLLQDVPCTAIAATAAEDVPQELANAISRFVAAHSGRPQHRCVARDRYDDDDDDDDDDSKPMFAFALQQQYSLNALKKAKVNALKGVDRERAGRLIEANELLGAQALDLWIIKVRVCARCSRGTSSQSMRQRLCCLAPADRQEAPGLRCSCCTCCASTSAWRYARATLLRGCKPSGSTSCW